jgi:exosortase A-associated hydrolase 1
VNEPVFDEEVLDFGCEGQRLWGVLTRPAATLHTTAVLIVVGGPQYRVGSHRQFVLLARSIARAGFAVLRFDYRGMGDSEGDEPAHFERSGPDIRAALDALTLRCPLIDRFVVWGLCDAASAALMHASTDRRVVGIVAANPWVRSDASLAGTRMRHYYAKRVIEREFWAKLLGGGFAWRAALRSFATTVRDVLSRRAGGSRSASVGRFQDVMANGLRAFHGRLLLVVSGNDLTAKEFLHFADSDPLWRGLLRRPHVDRYDIPDADHTFSRQSWREAIEVRTVEWLNELVAGIAAHTTQRVT